MTVLSSYECAKAVSVLELYDCSVGVFYMTVLSLYECAKAVCIVAV